MQPVVGVSASTDGQLFATISTDGTAKVFDVVNFGECLLLVFICEAHERLQI
jgi:WD40 repeat protein